MAMENMSDVGKIRRVPSGASLVSASGTLRRSNSGASLTTGLKKSGSGASLVSGLLPFKSKSKVRADEATLTPGDMVEVICMVVMRATDEIDSEVVMELPLGTRVEVLEVGTEHRVKVSARGTSGWIGLRNRWNEPNVVKRSLMDKFSLEGFEVGGHHEVKSGVTVRKSEGLDSRALAELYPGALVQILEICPPCRAKVLTSSGPDSKVEGWITLMNKNGEPLLGKLSGNLGKAATGNTTAKDKAILEAARAGNLEALKKSVDGGFMNFKKLSVNCSDVRGKTPLIYASALGHASVVDWLLTKPGVDILAVDDTQRSALHHAAKFGTSAASAGIVKSLLAHRDAFPDARDHIGCTPLMFAAANGNCDMAASLLSAKATVNMADFEGCTPLEYAKSLQQPELVQFLREHGAAGEESSDGDGGSEPTVSTAAPSLPDATPEASAAPSPAASPTASDDEAVVPTVAAPGNDIEKIKADPKKKKKVMARVSTKKSAAKQANISMAMDSGKQDEFRVEVAAADSGEDPKERALASLSQVLETASFPKELETAIEVAAAAGVEQADLLAAQAKLKELKHRARALEKLLAAMDSSHMDLDKLRDAVTKAEKYKVSSSELQRARAKLAQEEPKEKAREQLRRAADEADANKLKLAIKDAKGAGLDSEELAPFSELLRGVKSRESAEASLQKALNERDVVALRFAMKQASAVGVEDALIKQAQGVLDVEEPRARARQLLLDAVNGTELSALREAICAAQAAGLCKDETAEAEQFLQQAEARAMAVAHVLQVVEECKQVSTSSVEELRKAKDALTEAIREAKIKDVPESELTAAEQRRRKVHNAIEDLKGSIRVFCRQRPLNKREREEGAVEVLQKIDSMTIKTKDGTSFGFDAVFNPGTQEEVFEDCRDLVQSAVDGYNVTMFAYGQTGAGKTYTMYGSPDNEGTAPRSIREIYRVIERESSRFNFTVMGSMLELYQNDLIDLLSEGAGPAKKLNIKTDSTGSVLIERLREEECKDADELAALLERGNRQRTVAATAMNSESSRSHLLFVIKIISVNRETHEKLKGKILLCDLAGSERLKKSEVIGEMKKEAIEINKSLTALGDVIEALTKGQKQIPYRNHKLTQVMQDSLGGTAKTLMFVNCSPADTQIDETMMALKYATRAKQITNTCAKKPAAQ